MAKVELTLSEEDKKSWLSFCKAKGLSSAAMLRKIMKDATQGSVINESDSLNKVNTKRVTVRLTDQDFLTLTERARLEGFPSRPSWVKALIYATLDQEAIVSDKEIMALDRSIRELMAIGRNLNQITRMLNIDFRDSNKVTKELIEGLIEQIDLHTDKVAELIQRSVSRYEMEYTS